MVTPLRLALLLVVVGAIIVVWPSCTYACSCRPPGTPTEELGQSNAVFQGTVVSVKTPTGPVASSADTTTVTFDVSNVWKGQISRTHTITTPGSSASCGFTFEQGKEYVVYGRANAGALSVISCSRTRAIGDATEDIAALGMGQPPSANAQVPPLLPATGAVEPVGVFGSVQSLGVICGLLIIVGGAVILAINRRVA